MRPKKNTLSLLAGLTMLLMTTNLYASLPTSEQLPAPANVEYKLDLDIPKELVLKKGDIVKPDVLFAYDRGQFELALDVFANYHALAEAHIFLLEDLEAADEKNLLFSYGLVKCTDTLDKVEKDRQFIYSLRAKEAKDNATRIRKEKAKTFLLVSSGVVVGIGLGIGIGFLIGFFGAQ